MNNKGTSPFTPPAYDDAGDAPAPDSSQKTEGSEHNRGHRPAKGAGVVKGSGAGTGGGGNPEDYDSDPVSGGPAQLDDGS